MSINANADVVAAIARINASTVSHGTYAIDVNDVVTEVGATGPPVVHTGLKAAANDAARGQSIQVLAQDHTQRRHLK
jgi:hypothetical protein